MSANHFKVISRHLRVLALNLWALITNLYLNINKMVKLIFVLWAMKLNIDSVLKKRTWILVNIIPDILFQ